MHRHHVGVGDAALEVVLEAAVQGHRHLSLIAVPGADEIRDLRVSRIRAVGHAVDRGRTLVVAGRRVVEQVRVDRARIAILVEMGQVELEAGDLVDLLLEAEAALPGVRILVVGADDARRLRRRDRLGLRVARHAARRVRHPERSVRAASAGRRQERRGDHLAEDLRAEGHVRDRRGEIEAGAAADDEIVLSPDVVGEAAARRHVPVVADVVLVAEV